MNKNYKNCDRGHFYSATFSSCPHCLKDSPESDGRPVPIIDETEKTIMMGNEGVNPVPSSSNFGGDSSVTRDTVKVGTPFGGGSGDEGRTVVVSSARKTGEPGDVPKSTPSRKLVGWLVSYTINELGVDFRLYEGQNSIGRDGKNTVRVTEDSSISSHHATILYRGGQFYLRDEMSTNPSFVNGEEVMPGNTIKLKDGDSIMVGKTVLLIRFSALPDSV